MVWLHFARSRMALREQKLPGERDCCGETCPNPTFRPFGCSLLVHVCLVQCRAFVSKSLA